MADVALQSVSHVVSPSECQFPIYEVGVPTVNTYLIGLLGLSMTMHGMW